MKLNKNYFLVSGLLIAAPIVISQIIKLPFGDLTIGDENSWVGFFGGYIGAITGAIVAFIVAKYQVTVQNQKQIANEEMLSYINQKPALLKIQYELEGIHNSILVIIQRESIKEFQTSYSMYELNETFWSDIDQVQDTDTVISLINISNTYKVVFQNFTLDVHDLRERKKNIERGFYFSPPTVNRDYETERRMYELARQIDDVTEKRQRLIRAGEIEELSQNIQKSLDLIRETISGIDETRNKRLQASGITKN
ncbi:hypothetical protein [Paenibacillus xylanexedens]|uniref:hypothetical protein n=1 Tax=Paenibacillus xylanexedens TaxID=528191 RepID=UPI000F53AC00|nr:hypothetical protein [Paenibacillus xylanexedens]RPK29970.1 hypothetical protein EDO6_00595 [Paenibacillus xylanexedens]